MRAGGLSWDLQKRADRGRELHRPRSPAFQAFAMGSKPQIGCRRSWSMNQVQQHQCQPISKSIRPGPTDGVQFTVQNVGPNCAYRSIVFLSQYPTYKTRCRSAKSAFSRKCKYRRMACHRAFPSRVTMRSCSEIKFSSIAPFRPRHVRPGKFATRSNAWTNDPKPVSARIVLVRNQASRATKSARLWMKTEAPALTLARTV